MSKITCPVCGGNGQLEAPKGKTKQDPDGRFAHAAKALKAEGYTVREIARLLGYKHPGSVSHLLSKP